MLLTYFYIYASFKSHAFIVFQAFEQCWVYPRTDEELLPCGFVGKYLYYSFSHNNHILGLHHLFSFIMWTVSIEIRLHAINHNIHKINDALSITYYRHCNYLEWIWMDSILWLYSRRKRCKLPQFSFCSSKCIFVVNFIKNYNNYKYNFIL